jgi:formate C-acetyltransferase
MKVKYNRMKTEMMDFVDTTLVEFQQVLNKVDSLAMSEKIESLRNLLINEPRFASIEQARIITETYQANQDESKMIRRALSLAASLRNISIRIDPGEIIVGNRTPGIRGGVVFPEAGLSWLEKEIDTLDSRDQDRFQVRPEDVKYFHSTLVPYWTGKTLEDGILAQIGVNLDRMGKVVKINQKDHAQGHIIPNVRTWLTLGPSGLLAKVRQRAVDAEADQREFLRAVEIVLEGARDFIRRYADLAVALQTQTEFQRYSAELRVTSKLCRKLADGAAESFHEAVQSLWFLFVILHMESNASSFSPGRLDQYLYPFFLKSLESGEIDLERALQIIESLWLSFNKIVYLRNSTSARYFAGFPIGFNIALAGKNADGSDSANLLSFLCLKATEHIGLPQPNLSVRLHKNSPEWFVDKCSQVIGRGSGMPQIFNDESVIPALTDQGIDGADAFDYGVVGCVELSTQGNSLGWSDAAMFNLVKILELTLNNGECLISGDTIGPPSGRLNDYATFEDLLAAYKQQIAYFVEKMIAACDFVDRFHGQSMPSPFLSSVIDDCLKKGLDVTAGGARYNLSGIQAIQVANVADSLAVLKQLVFESKQISPADLLTALKANWLDQEKMRQRVVNHVPKYGNDVEWVDELGARIVRYFSSLLSTYANARGGRYHMGLYTVSAHVPMGRNVGASPDGRFAGSPLADGGVSAMYGRDEQGPTALLKSVSRINGRLSSNGSLLNLKFLPEFFTRNSDRKKFNALLRSFCRMSINHVQFNVVRKEDLLNAQENPDAYRGLTIRVAGYTAYFTELDEDLQNEIIARTSHGV